MSPWWPRCCASRPLGTGHSTGQSRTGRRRRGAQAHEEHRHAHRSRSSSRSAETAVCSARVSCARGENMRTASVPVRARWGELCCVHGCCVCVHSAPPRQRYVLFSLGLERAMGRQQTRAGLRLECGASCQRSGRVNTASARTARVFIKACCGADSAEPRRPRRRCAR